MAMVVKNNMSALSTLNTLNKNTKALSKSLQKVSSGMKINSAADDASGYAISERMRVQIRSLDQANSNAQNGGSMLKVADFGIQSLQVRDVDPLLKLSKGAMNYLNVETVHTVQDDAGETNTYVLNMAEESDGTNSYFKLIGIIKNALEQGTLLVADEIDAHLHPLLTKHLVMLFNNSDTNPNGAQLIFTSHNTNLLDLDILRRDQIWFTEKDDLTAATDLFSLYDFSIRKDAKVEKGYLLGRYGAIPFIHGGLLNG